MIVQTKQVLKNIGAVLADEKLTLDDFAKVNLIQQEAPLRVKTFLQVDLWRLKSLGNNFSGYFLLIDYEVNTRVNTTPNHSFDTRKIFGGKHVD